MKAMDQEVIDKYNTGFEKHRLRTGLGLIEAARTRELLVEFLPPPPGIIYDIGGGYGEYAWYLASLGYEVHLFDISSKNIDMSDDLCGEYPNTHLAAAEVADARAINRPDNSADAILLMGPLYHLVDLSERLAALRESYRLLKPGGVLFTAAITRYATTLWAMTSYGIDNCLLADAPFVEMLMQELTDGQHIKPENSPYHGMVRSFFHLPETLRDELLQAGFVHNDVRGIIGCGWLVPNLDAVWQDELLRETILRILRKLEKDESILGLSTHLLAVSQKAMA